MTNKPNLFIIGASKCGTTFLHHLLEQHPEVCMSSVKEPCFFNREDYKGNLQWYSSLFDHRKGEKIVGESSPIYSETTYFQDIPKRIYEFNSKAKLIYIVREPFSRLNSVYKQTISTGHWYEKKFYDRTMSKEFNEAVISYPPYLEATKYWTHIENYRRYFEDSQIKVILFEDLTNNYHQTMKQIFEFLEIDSNCIPSEECSKKNESADKRIYNPTIKYLSSFTPGFIKKITPKKIKNIILRYVNFRNNDVVRSEPLTKENIDKINSTLEDEVKKLYIYLGIENDPWKFFKSKKWI